MLQSRHLGHTLRETPRDAQTASHKLLLRGGFMKQTAAGVYSYLPLLTRTLAKISQIVREEMNASGAEELLMPALQPSELWLESGRWERYTQIDGIMFAFQDRRKSVVCLGPTHEEIITDIVRGEVQSYKELPKTLYQIQTKFRDEIRPRFGLMRAREFIMKDAYSFDVDVESMQRSYAEMSSAYHRICTRLGLRYRSVAADSGAIGGSSSEEFMVLAESGEDTILYCDTCDYAANVERAESRLDEFQQDAELLPMEEVLGEGLIGVEKLSEFLGIPVWKTTKTILYEADEKLVAVMVRGDSAVNEIKVLNHLGAKELKLASPETVQKLTGAEVGYAGPIGLPEDTLLLADRYVGGRVNFECGANRTHYHNINVNIGRDLPAPEFGDFKLAATGECCPHCDSGRLLDARGIEVGHIFALGSQYSEALGCTYLDQAGASHPMQMGCYGIGITRLAAAAVEQNNDDNGIAWPMSIAPYQVHLIGLNLEKDFVREACDTFYRELSDAGVEVLYDDRDLRAGEKFSDADLIGIPLRITLSKRALDEQAVEIKERVATEAVKIPMPDALRWVSTHIGKRLHNKEHD